MVVAVAEAVVGRVDHQGAAVVRPAAVEGAEGVVARVARQAAVGGAVDRVDHPVAAEVAVAVAAAAAAVLWLHLQGCPLNVETSSSRDLVMC